MAFCTNCGKELTDGAKFCASCGTSTEGTVSEPKTAAKKESVLEKLPTAEAKEKINAGKEKVNADINKLPFKKLAEEKIPAGARAKFPLLEKAIPFANQIVCGLAVLVVAVIIVAAISSSSDSGGGSALNNTLWEGGGTNFIGAKVKVTIKFSKKNFVMTTTQSAYGIVISEEVEEGTYKISGENGLTLIFPDREREGTFTDKTLIINGNKFERL
jgi:hypothetical protein